jgi:iron uptake system component EfeO
MSRNRSTGGRHARSVAALLVVGLAVSACGSTAPDLSAPSVNAIGVRSTADECSLSSSTAPAGPTSFRVTNGADAPTAVVVVAPDGARIVGQLDGVKPALTRELTVVLKAGTYTVACTPGQAGDSIRSALTVTGATTAATSDVAELSRAVTAYQAWVVAEAARLESGTTAFVAAVRAGDLATAKALYAPTRASWERIEPIATTFRDLDLRLDARAQEVEDLASWTGWHRLEKALWADASLAGMEPVAAQLVADTRDLVRRIGGVTLTIDQVTSAATELVEAIASSELSGEEELYSHTDLSDFQGNLDGAREAWKVVAAYVAARDPNLTKAIELAFHALQVTLDPFRRGDGFVPYTDLSPAQVRALAAKVEALSEPLSRLTATVVS